MRIAVIDDTPVNLQLISALTHSASGFRPECFEDPEDGLAWCIENTPDLILVDYMMPKIDGCDFIVEIRKRRELDETPIVMITAADSSELRRRALELGATEFISKPIDNAEFKARIKNLCELRRARKLLADKAERLEEEVDKAVATIRAREVELLLRLARAVESRTAGSSLPALHGDRVGQICAVVAMGLGMDSAYQAQMIAAGATHDIGLLSVPDRVLQAHAPLSASEEASMRTHPQAGHFILDGSRSELAKMAAAIALSHHERWDGQGYPQQIQGESIPLEARICAVANEFDELLAIHPDAPEQAMLTIESLAGTAFDPHCVEALRRSFPAALAVLSQFPR